MKLGANHFSALVERFPAGRKNPCQSASHPVNAYKRSKDHAVLHWHVPGQIHGVTLDPVYSSKSFAHSRCFRFFQSP